MANIVEITLTLPHRSIAALTWGPENGKRILALHGWLDNAASFIPLFDYLKDFKVVAIDLPGHGLSSHIPTGSYFHFTDYIAEIVDILDYLGWEESSLLGHSLGAGLTTIIAGVNPARISSLGLIDGIGAITFPPRLLPSMMLSSIDEYKRLSNKKPKYYATTDEAIDARLLASKMQRSSIELLVTRGLKSTEHGFIWRTDPRLLIPPLLLPIEEQLTPFLQQINAKTCFIRTESGWPVDKAIIDKRVELIKNITVHTVAGDHHVHMDNPSSVGPILKDFFNK